MWQISWKTCVSEVCVTHFDDVSYKQILAAPNYTVCCMPPLGTVFAGLIKIRKQKANLY